MAYGSTIPHFRVYQNTPTSTQLTQPAPTSTQLTFTDMKKCANRSCKRTKISANCAKGLCAICCVMLLDACTYPAHDRKRAQEHAARTAQPKLHGPWSVMHPLPADIPETNRVRSIAPPPSQLLSPPPATLDPSQAATFADHSQLDPQPAEAFERRHRKQFGNCDWKNSWTRQESDRRRREDAETLRRENIIAMKQSFRLAFWGDDTDATPLRTTIDYVLTWPTFALSQSSEVLALLSLSADDYIDTYVVGARYWETQKTSKPFHLVTGQLLLFRRRGVVTCRGIDAVIDEAVGEQHPHTPVPPTLSVTVVAPKPQGRAKRALEDVDGHEERTGDRATPRLSLSQLSPNDVVSPSRAHLSPNDIVSPTRTSLSLLSPQFIVSPSRSLLSTSSSYRSISPSPSPTPHQLYTFPAISPLPFVLDPALASHCDPPSTSQLPASSPSPPATQCSVSSELPLGLSPAASDVTGLGLGTIDWSQPLAGNIHIPPGARWPDEFYACDVAIGFYTLGRMISLARNNGRRRVAISKTAMFAQIFPGVEYSSSNVYANWKFWTGCTEEEREALAHTP